MRLYLDTNVFIYLSNRKYPYYVSCRELIASCRSKSIPLVTSAETFQEIIHWSKNKNRLKNGIEIVKRFKKIVWELFPVDETIVDLYLEKASRYKQVPSRDLIHLATCIENKIKHIVTLDKDFNFFKEVVSLAPHEALEFISAK